MEKPFVKPVEQLKEKLRRIDGADYGAYQSIKGAWMFPRFELYIDRIPKDPFAPPHTGVYRARVPRGRAGFSAKTTSSGIREIALRDYLTRRFHEQCAITCKGRRGTGNSGIITIAGPGQAILERTSAVIDEDFVEVRFFIGMPARGRRVKADTAETMLFEEVPQIIEATLFAENLDIDHMNRHIATAEDADFLRKNLRARGLAAFIADGALLPRASGIDPSPLDSSAAVPFKSPEKLRVSFDLPNAGAVAGMGVPMGVTLIVGGGYHGKSTLLEALALGVYNHIPGDGRECCASLSETVKVRASSGRSVVKTDISAFINDIPLREPTTSFTTANASGSTSQAAFIAEAIEVGAGVILMDEDTCATNFMIRDKRMQELVAKEHEPITPFIDKVRQLYEGHGISTVLVMGGSGDYLNVADCVIQMTEFEPLDVTARARDIAKRFATKRAPEGGDSFKLPLCRFPLGDALDPKNEYGRTRVKAPGTRRLIFGGATVDLNDVEQLIETAQTKSIGRAILYAREYMDGNRSMKQIVDLVMEDIRKGLDVLDPQLTGDLAQFRGMELAAALNRMRSLKMG